MILVSLLKSNIVKIEALYHFMGTIFIFILKSSEYTASVKCV